MYFRLLALPLIKIIPRGSLSAPQLCDPLAEPLLLSLLMVVLGMATGLTVYLSMALTAEAHQVRPRVAERLALSRCPSTFHLDDMMDTRGSYHLPFFQMSLAEWVRLKLLQP